MSQLERWQRERATWPHQHLSRFVDAGGVLWHVQQAGAGPPLLLVHGAGGSAHSWRELLPIFARDYAVLAPDLPGHGFSGRTTRASIAGMSESLAALLQALEIRPEYCIGHSAGAVILCRLALDARISPRAIISVNGAFLPLAGAAGIFFSPIARLLGKSSLLPRLIARRAGNASSVARVIESTGSELSAEGLDLYARLVRSPEHLAGTFAMMGSWDLGEFVREDLPRLTTPLELVVAENDRTVPPEQALAVRRRVAGAAIHRLPGLGHLAHEEEPQRIAQELIEICRAHAPRSARDGALSSCAGARGP